MGLGGIPLKRIKISISVVDKYLTSMINHDILLSYFSARAKKLQVRPIYKKNDRQNKENYCPVRILNGFSKVYERFMNDGTLSIIQTFLLNFVSA